MSKDGGNRWKSHTGHPLSIGVIKEPTRSKDKSQTAKRKDELERECWGTSSSWDRYPTYSVKFQKHETEIKPIGERVQAEEFKMQRSRCKPGDSGRVLPYTQMFHIHTRFQQSKYLLYPLSAQLPIPKGLQLPLCSPQQWNVSKKNTP